MAKQNPKFTRKVLTSYTIEGEYTNNGTIVTDDGEERDLLVDLQTFNNCYIKITVKQVGTRSRQNVRQLKSPYNAKKRYKIPLDQQDFTPLQDKLEEWIEEETMKINNEVK